MSDLDKYAHPAAEAGPLAETVFAIALLTLRLIEQSRSCVLVARSPSRKSESSATVPENY